MATILLSIAAVLTAYCAYESARWSGVQATAFARASGLRVESSKAAAAAVQQLSYDALIVAEIGIAALEGKDLIAKEIRERLARPEFRPYLDEWLALKPVQNPEAPRSPFELPNFRNRMRERVGELDQQANAQFAAAEQANQVSDDYVLATVFFAAQLFFAGISTKMASLRARVVLLAIGAMWLVLGVARMATLPFY